MNPLPPASLFGFKIVEDPDMPKGQFKIDGATCRIAVGETEAVRKMVDEENAKKWTYDRDAMPEPVMLLARPVCKTIRLSDRDRTELCELILAERQNLQNRRAMAKLMMDTTPALALDQKIRRLNYLLDVLQ